MSCGNTRPTVSVVVPVWGAERTLDRCVQSILGQRLRTGTLACVLVDDGSPDRCGAMCDEYARRDARVRVLHKEDGGVSSARNAGLRASEGEYVVFLDSDDALRPGALQAALDAQAADPGAFVLWRYTDDAGDPAAAGPEAAAAPQSALARLYLDCLIAMPWNKLYRGDLARRLRFNESFTLGEDLQFVLDYIALLGREQPEFHYAAVQSPLTFYDCSRDDGTLSTRYHPEVCEIWPQHFAKLNAAAQAAGAPAEDLLPLYRAELRVFAEGAADILRRDPAAPAQRRRKAAAALRCPWLRALLGQMRAARCYSPYYLPLRWRCLPLLYRLAEADRTGSPLFGKLDWAGYYLLGGRWKRAE